MKRPALPLAVPLALAALAAPLLGGVPSAQADHSTPPDSVALVGSLQSELGCAEDWAPACDATELQLVDGVWTGTFTVPAGDHEYKVALDDGWAESHGAGGDANMPLSLERETELVFTYDPENHGVAVAPTATPAPAGPGDRALAGNSLRNALSKERLYFVMADRFSNGDRSNDDAGLGQDRLVSGYDPTDTGFFHGGDLQGIVDRLDYIEELGTTAIWLTPSFKNKPVQGAPGSESAGYHGYWITDFTQIDPHLGSNADMRKLVRAAHKRGIKIFFDIITNHTADVITYDRESYDSQGNLPYVPTDEEPYRDTDGEPFDDRDYADGGEEFPEVDQSSFPYAPVVPEAEQDVKVPGWLNDPTLYHNRGTSTFAGESSLYGDFPSGAFSSLDDLWTEHPKVVQGMTDIYKTWVQDFGIDGFRIDTVKHVNTEFWQQFAPALVDSAKEVGNDDFFMFGEVYDASSKFVSQYTTEGRLQAAVDFGFQANATGFAKGGPTAGMRDFYAEDDWYTDADSNAYQLPTFLGNHDMGRIGSFLRQDPRNFGERELLERDELAHALMYLTRGQPVVYYGDEQGFSAPGDVAGGIGDQRAREDMFPSKVDLYNSYDLIGSKDSTSTSNFKKQRPLYRHIQALAELRESHPTLADGAQVTRHASDGPGVFAFSRIKPGAKRELVVALNNSRRTRTVTLDTYRARTTYKRVWPAARTKRAQERSDARGRIKVSIPPLSAKVWRATARVQPARGAPRPSFTSPVAGGVVADRAEIGVDVPGKGFRQTTFAWRVVGSEDWQVLGTDDNAPYRVFHDVRDLPLGTAVEYRAISKDIDGSIGVDQTHAMVGTPEVEGGTPDWGGPVTQPGAVSVPGSFNSEVGCSADWLPDCAAVDLTLDAEDGVWSKTFAGEQTIPDSQYAYKAAIDDAWDENYGAKGEPNGGDINLNATGDPITFWYSHATHWVTNSVDTPHLYTAVGDLQSEAGCSEDGEAACLATWLQDPDGDGEWTYRNHTLPAGDYSFRVAVDRSVEGGTWGAGGDPAGEDVTVSVADGEGLEIRFTPPESADPADPASTLTASTYPAPAAP